MKAFVDFQKKLIEQNKREFGLIYNQLKKVGYYQSFEAEDSRSRSLESLKEVVAYAFNHTKPYAHAISPGCWLCGQGEWSCLFLNNRCNCNCFYCPTAQTNDRLPETQGLSFLEPEPYIEYLRKFGFKGASISGGEPLLAFPLALDFISRIRKEFGNEMYLWLYTNGRLLTEDMAQQLADAGLNEIRFDISATGYSVKFLKRALGKIPHVTVEIPAIPEDLNKLKSAILTLNQLGGSFLNLHQLRLTPFNSKKLLSRNYTFLHGQKMTVLESELAAVEILAYVFENELKLPVNYCSFQYKNHFQKAGFRRKFGHFVLEPAEEITANGFIRRISLDINTPGNHVLQQLSDKGILASGGDFAQADAKVILKKKILNQLKLGDSSFVVEYFSVQISEKEMEQSRRFLLNSNSAVFIQRNRPVTPLTIDIDIRDAYFAILDLVVDETIQFSDTLFTASLFEIPVKGFADYF